MGGVGLGFEVVGVWVEVDGELVVEEEVVGEL